MRSRSLEGLISGYSCKFRTNEHWFHKLTFEISMSSEVVWSVIRKSSSFARSSNGTTFSAESNNMFNRHSFRDSGLVKGNAAGVELINGKPTLTRRHAKKANRPASAVTKVGLSQGLVKGNVVITKSVGNNFYRPEHKRAALARFTKLTRATAKSSVGTMKSGRTVRK